MQPRRLLMHLFLATVAAQRRPHDPQTRERSGEQDGKRRPREERVEEDGRRLVIGVEDPDAVAPAVVRALVAAEADVQLVEREKHSLERIYMELIDESGEVSP